MSNFMLAKTFPIETKKNLENNVGKTRDRAEKMPAINPPLSL